MAHRKREAQATVQNILLNATGNKKPPQEEIRIAFALGENSEMRRQLHAATYITSLWVKPRRLIVNYYEYLQGVKTLKTLGPNDPNHTYWNRMITFNRTKAGKYEQCIIGMQEWQAEYNREMFHPLEIDGMNVTDPEIIEVPPLKLDYARLAGIIERTDELDHPAIRAANDVAERYPDEFCRDAFQFGSHLLRFVIDAPIIRA